MGTSTVVGKLEGALVGACEVRKDEVLEGLLVVGAEEDLKVVELTIIMET
jgi:hypothetical protein